MAVEQITYKNIDPRTRTAIMTGLVLAMLCACFDGTIIGTCGPNISQELNGPGLYTWMVTAYLLCECIMIPIAGKLSDLYGRKNLFLIGLFIFVGGSVIAGLSTNMEMLVVCRGIQGVGGGILIPVATAAVADLYAPEARAKMQGILGAVFGVGSGVGPIIGGLIYENVDWRWCFYINVPISIVAFLLTIKKFPAPAIVNKPIVDYKGISLLAVGLACLIIFFEMGGSTFAWVSVESFIIFAVMVVAFVLFVMVEKRAPEPVLSPSILHNRTIVAGAIFMLIFGMGMMGAMTFSSYFGIYVLFDGNPLTASYYSLFMVVGMMITSTVSGFLCEKVGYRPWIILGPVVTFIAMLMMYTLSIGGITPDAGATLGYNVIDKPLVMYSASLFVLGFGLGLMATPIMAAVQNASKDNEIGMNTSSVNLCRSIGTALGTALFTLIINAKYVSETSGIVAPGLTDKATEFLSAVIGSLMSGSIDAANAVMNAFINSVEFGFLLGGIIILCAAVVGYFIKAKTTTQLLAEKAAAEKAGKDQ